MSTASSRVERLAGRSRPEGAGTEMSGEGPWLHPCFPLRKFSAISLKTSFPPECPSSSPHPLQALRCPPARSFAAHAARPSRPSPCCHQLWRWESAGLSWCLCPCPLCSQPCTLQQSPSRGGQAALAGVAAETRSEVLPPVLKLQEQQTQAARNPELRSPGRREKLSPAE